MPNITLFLVKLFFGAWMLLTPFMLSQYLISGLTYLALRRLLKEGALHVISLAGVLTWVSLFVNKGSPNAIMTGRSGFPLRALEHPLLMRATHEHDPLTRWWWGSFYANWFFWLAFAVLIWVMIRKSKNKFFSPYWTLAVLILVTLLSLGTIVMMYD